MTGTARLGSFGERGGDGVSTPNGDVYNTKNQIGSSTYDGAGNILQLPPGYTFVYDAENRITGETNSGGLRRPAGRTRHGRTCLQQVEGRVRCAFDLCSRCQQNHGASHVRHSGPDRRPVITLDRLAALAAYLFNLSLPASPSRRPCFRPRLTLLPAHSLQHLQSGGYPDPSHTT